MGASAAVKPEPVAVVGVASAVKPEPAAPSGLAAGAAGKPDIDDRSPEEIEAIQLELTKFDLKWLLSLPQLPLKGGDEVANIVDLTTKLRLALDKIRRICRDKHPTRFVPGWDEVLHRYVQKAVRLTDPRAPHVSQVITNSFAIATHLVEEGVRSGPEMLDVLVRELCSGMSSVTAADVFNQLQDYTVPAGTTFKDYFVKLKLLVNQTG